MQKGSQLINVSMIWITLNNFLHLIHNLSFFMKYFLFLIYSLEEGGAVVTWLVHSSLDQVVWV